MRASLQIRDNIALGDPSSFSDDDRVRLAARMGGAEAFIDKIPEGYDTYLTYLSRATGSGPQTGNKTRSGKTFDMSAVWEAAGFSGEATPELSGGQMQRLAV